MYDDDDAPFDSDDPMGHWEDLIIPEPPLSFPFEVKFQQSRQIVVAIFQVEAKKTSFIQWWLQNRKLRINGGVSE